MSENVRDDGPDGIGVVFPERTPTVAFVGNLRAEIGAILSGLIPSRDFNEVYQDRMPGSIVVTASAPTESMHSYDSGLSSDAASGFGQVQCVQYGLGSSKPVKLSPETIAALAPLRSANWMLPGSAPHAGRYGLQGCYRATGVPLDVQSSHPSPINGPLTEAWRQQQHAAQRELIKTQTQQILDDSRRELIAALSEEVEALRRENALLKATQDEPRARDRVGPDDPTHRNVHDVIGDLLGGKVTKPARDALGDALGKANAPVTGRTSDGTHRAPDSKAFRLSKMDIGMRLP